MAFIIPAVVAAASAIGTAASTAGAAIGIGSAAAGTAATVGGVSAATLGAEAGGALSAFSGIGAASAVPAWLSTAGLASTAISGVTGAYGAVKSANAEAAAAKYNASEAQVNAGIAKQNEALSAQSGEEQVAQQQQRTRAEVGASLANQAASGVDVNSGSAVDVRMSESELGQLDALNVRSNATREAFGYSTQASNFKNEASLDSFEAKNDTSAGVVNAAGTLLGSAGSAASNFYKYKLNGGFSY